MVEVDQNVILAKVAEQAERYDEMKDFMTERVALQTPLNLEERDMFSAAFKNALTGRRHAVRVAVSVQQQEAANADHGNAALAAGYKTKVEAELQGLCTEALQQLHHILVPMATPGEEKTFYLKMQGDYNRYLAEFAEGASRDEAASQALACYSAGLEAGALLDAAHPVRLGLALNFSVFQHEVICDTSQAITIATEAMESASISLQGQDRTTMPNYDDAHLTMRLLKDNLTLWNQQ